MTIPSQIRFVEYYGRVVRDKLEYQPTTLIFKSIHLHGIPNIQGGTCAPFFTIRQGPEKVLIFKSQVYEGISKDQKEAVLLLDPATPGLSVLAFLPGISSSWLMYVAGSRGLSVWRREVGMFPQNQNRQGKDVSFVVQHILR